MNTFVFDIETIPDLDNARKLYNFEDIPDNLLYQTVIDKRMADAGTEFMPLHLHKIVAISAVFANREQLKVWSLGDKDSDEKELISRFFSGIAKCTPVLVSWNGSGFDLPVLHYRSLLHGIAAPRYWEFGESDPNFRWNNYLNRYHYRHLDLMDVIAGYQNRANAPLDHIASMIGLPGKMGMSGNKVWDYYKDGKIEAIRDYCETDVLNTYLVFQRFELIRGRVTEAQYKNECDRVYQVLTAADKPHLNEFCEKWNRELIND